MSRNTETKKSGVGKLGVLFVLALATAQFATTYSQFQLSPIQQNIMREVGMTASQYVQAFTAPMLPAVFLSFVSGLMVDKLGPQRVIGVALLISVIGGVARIWCGSYVPYLLAMACTGLAPAFIHSNSAKIIGPHFPRERLGSALGFALLGGNLANVFGVSTTAFLPGSIWAYSLSGIFGVLAFCLWLFICGYTRKQPQPVSTKSEEKYEATIPLLQMIRTVVRSRITWLVSISMLFMQAYQMTISSTAPSALRSLGYSAGTASLMASCLSIGSPVGCLLGPSLLARTKKPRQVLQIMILCAAVAMPLLWHTTSPVLTLLVMFYSSFCYGTCQVSMMAVPSGLPEIGRRYAGTAGGLLTTVQMVGAVTLPSWVLVPLAGENYVFLYCMAGFCMVIAVAVMCLIPGSALKGGRDRN